MTTSLGWLLIVLAGSFTKSVFGGENCDDPDRLIVCHIETKLHPSTDPCSCTHIVLHNPHDPETVEAAQKLREKNRRLKILSLAEEGKKAQLEGVSGVYLRLGKSLSKEQVVKNVKTLATDLDNHQASKRANAKYSSGSSEDISKDVAELFLELPSSPEQLAKNYDLKSLNKYINYFIITSDNLTDSSEEGLAYHPSRLMGIDDILNADSLVDLISGLGAEHEKLLISLPATALKFNLKDPKDNMPRAKVTTFPEAITQHELCTLIENGVWTLERDEDLTAPYAYSNTTWLAFDDSVSAAIKAKYILLRGLAGISVSKSEADDWSHECASRPIVDTIYGTFTNLVRKPRAATLLSLQDQIHNSITPFAGDVQLSPFRIVRVVDRAGSIHVVRKEAKTEFQCSRQGYFTHPSGCNRFYRCVKFNQYSSDFTVFEYDCPAGLAFDERYEVCVWPGSLPDASACKGSSEIAPVPRSRYACRSEGYFADPENCRWFFACLDHHGDGSPPTAYEFRCPFGLVFNEETLTCDWPWAVRGCGTGSVGQSSVIYPGDILEGRLRPAYAQVSDVHVSGGRIANVDGGLVLGTNLLSGISTSGHRYSNGYGLGLAKQVNSAFGNSGHQDNSGAYIHDPTGDTGGEYVHQGGPNGPGSYYAGQGATYSSYSGGVNTGNSGQYIHDSRGDAGGDYSHSEGSSGSSSYAGSSGSFGGQYTEGGSGIYGTGKIGVGNSGAYVHDSRGDTVGSYIHQEGLNGPGSKAYEYSGSSSIISGNAGIVSGQANVYDHSSSGEIGGQYLHEDGTGGQYLHEVGNGGHGSASYSGSKIGATGFSGTKLNIGLQQSVLTSGQGGQSSGAYIHDSRGNTGGQYLHEVGIGGQYLHEVGTGGQYLHEVGNGGHGSASYSGSKIGASGFSGTKLNVGLQQSVLTSGQGEQASGAYIHDSRGDTGGAYIHQEGNSGPGSVPYIHQEGSYGDRNIIGGSAIKTGQLYTTNYEGQNVLGSGEYSGGSYSSSSASGEYIHDSSGERGGDYVHLKGPSYYNSIYANRYSGQYLHDNSGSYVHDTRGDHAEPYVHQEGPSGPSGPLYQDVNVNNVYSVQYPGQYASKYGNDHTQTTNYLNLGAHIYQPQAGVIHTYDSSRLHVQPVGYVESAIKSYEHNFEKNQNLSPIGINKFSGASLNTGVKNIGTISVTEHPIIPLNPIQYVSHHKTNVYQPLSLIKETVPVISHSYQTPVIKTQTVSPLTVSSTPAVTYGKVHTINGFNTHVVQPIDVSTPSPVISYETPVIRTQTVRPITITSSPIVPLNPVQYEPIGSILKTGVHSYESHGFSTISPPTIKTQNLQPVQISQSVIHSQGSSFNHYPEQVAVSTPATPVSSYEFRPVFKAQTVRPVTVTGAPVIPLNPIQYGQKAVVSTAYSGYDYPKPKVTFNYPQQVIKDHAALEPLPSPPLISYSYHPSVPVAPIDTVIRQPAIKTNYISQTVVSSTPRPELIHYEQPLIRTQTVKPISVPSSQIDLDTVHYGTRIEAVGVSTPSPVKVHSFNPTIKTQTVRPVIVSSTPVVPLNAVQYGVKTVSSSLGYHYQRPAVGLSYPKEVSYSTQAPPVISYTYQKPIVKTQPIQPTIVSTPAPPVVSYSYQQPIKPAIPVSISTPAPPVVSYSYQQPIVPVSAPAPAPPAVSYSIQPRPFQPLVVSSTPAVPLNPIQYVRPIVSSTPAPPIINYSYKQTIEPISVSTPAPPVVSYSHQQPIKPVVSYSYKQPIVPVSIHGAAPPANSYSISAKPVQPIIVSSTPAVPYNPVQYVTTPAPPLVHYSYKQQIKQIAPVSVSTPAPPVVSYSYEQQPIRPVSLHPPAPSSVTYSIKSTVQPIIVSSTPKVPLNPVQYFNPIAISAPTPPLVHYSYKEHVKPVVPISVSKPAPAQPEVNYYYQQPIRPAVPISVSTPAPQIVSYSVKPKTIQPVIVSSTPAVPLNPVQYINPISVSTPAPPVVHYSYNQHVKPVAPISVSTPAPPVINYSYQQTVKPVIPVTVSTPSPPVTYSFKERPVQPIIVSSTPAVPLNPVQYVKPVPFSTPARPVVNYSYQESPKSAPPVINYSYQSKIKPAPFSFNAPSQTFVDYSYHESQKTVAPITFSSPAPHVDNYDYQKTISPVTVSTPSPFISYSYKARPVQPIAVSSTPVVPLNPVQYVKHVTTPAPPVINYSTPAPPVVHYSTSATPVIRYSTPAPPVVSYSQQASLRPVAPITVSTPAPPVVSYTYSAKPVQPIAVSSTPVVPLNPVQYVKSVVSSTPAPPIVNYSYNQPAVSTVFTAARPTIEPYAVNKASNVVFSYSFEAKPVQPVTVTSTPAIPLNPVQFSVRPAKPSVGYSYRRPTARPTVVTTSAPQISYSYEEEPHYFVKTKTIRPVTVTSTPAIPLNPVQYVSTTPQPVINYKYRNPVIKAHATVVAPPSSPVYYPSSPDYYDEEFVHKDIVKISQKPAVNSFYQVPTRTTTVAPITVSSTPLVPLNPVQYVNQALPVFNYNYQRPPATTYQTKGCCSSPSIQVSTLKPEILKTTISPTTIISSRKPVIGAYIEENYESNRQEQGYTYSRPSIKFEERPLIKQGIYSTVSTSTIAPEVTTSTYLQRPVQTYANTVEEESFISNNQGHVVTLSKQPIAIDSNDEDLNIHLDIPKIGVNQPIYSTPDAPQQQIVEVTTVTPVVKRVKVKGGLAQGGLTRGGYYVRRQKVKVQPVITTTENYPAYFTSTIKPIYSSTIDFTSPTLYRTTVRPTTVYTRPSTVYTTSSTTLKDDELEVEDEDNDARLLAEVSGQFGEIINTGNQGIIRHQTQGISSTTVSSLKDGETIIGVVKKERVEGGSKRAKVVVVSKLSDFNPLLVGKLGAECSCKSNSKTLNLFRGNSPSKGQLFFPEVEGDSTPSRGYLPSSPEKPSYKTYNLPTSQVPLSDIVSTTTFAPADYESNRFVEIRPASNAKRLYTSTQAPLDYSGAEYDLTTTKRSISKNRIGIAQEKTLSKGASFDRYGPGGLRGSDETLQGSIDCQRPGLFRHPKYCNKFYSCNWDQWKNRFTLHVFNCPIHLAYDSQLGACNWPSKGPACADDNLLV